jgi:hypothetical protein
LAAFAGGRTNKDRGSTFTAVAALTANAERKNKTQGSFLAPEWALEDFA